MAEVGDLYKPSPRAFTLDQIIQRGGDAGHDTVLVATQVNDIDGAVLCVRSTGREFSLWTNHFWHLVGDATFVPYVEQPSERFVIWNETARNLFVTGNNPDSYSYEEAVAKCRDVLTRRNHVVLHIIPLRSVTQVSAAGVEDWRAA